MINIADRMNELIKKLSTEGFRGLKWPEICPESPGDWDKDYAMCYKAYACTAHLDEAEDLLDMDGYDYDFDQFLRSFFGDDVVINRRPRCQEIEVYRRRVVK